MFELLNPPPKGPQDDPITIGETLGVGAMLLTLAFGSMIAAMLLSDQPHGLQLVTLSGYSGAVFIYTFFRTRGVMTRYRLSAPYVRRQLPRLLLIHCAYLLVLFVVAEWALTRQPELPELVLIVGFMLLAISEVVLSRTLLGRAKRASMNSMTTV